MKTASNNIREPYRFSTRFNIVLGVFLIFALSLTLFRILFAATPNPGHPWAETGDGVWAATGPTTLRTFTFPDASATVLTSNTAVTVAQGGTGATSLTGVLIGNGTSAFTATSTLAAANGGTGNSFTQFTGPASSVKTFTLPNASATILTSNDVVTLAQGGTNANLTASNGGIFYSTGSAGAILAGTATAGQILRSGSNAAPTWSTATYPATAGTTGNVLTSDGTNWVSSAPGAGGGGSTLFSARMAASQTADTTCHPTNGVCSATPDRTFGVHQPTAGTLKNLNAYMTTGPGAGANNCTFTIQKATGCAGAFSNTTLSCFVANPNTSCANATSTDAISAGECIRLFYDETGTCTGINSWSFEIQY